MNSILKNLRLILFFTVSSTILWSDEPSRTWTNIKGVKMEASLVRFKKDKIEIKRGDGRTFTLDPNMFSEEDQKYLIEARERTDSSGELWSKERAIYHLTRQKWATKEVGSPNARYQNFKREKIDLDGDGKLDGYKLWIQSTNTSYGRARAWEVTDEGNLIVRYKSSSSILEGEYYYDFKSGYFLKMKGSYYGENFYRPAEEK
jgi:hypothetical protein